MALIRQKDIEVIFTDNTGQTCRFTTGELVEFYLAADARNAKLHAELAETKADNAKLRADRHNAERAARVIVEHGQNLFVGQQVQLGGDCSALVQRVAALETAMREHTEAHVKMAHAENDMLRAEQAALKKKIEENTKRICKDATSLGDEHILLQTPSGNVIAARVSDKAGDD